MATFIGRLNCKIFKKLSLLQKRHFSTSNSSEVLLASIRYFEHTRLEGLPLVISSHYIELLEFMKAGHPCINVALCLGPFKEMPILGDNLNSSNPLMKHFSFTETFLQTWNAYIKTLQT